MFYNQQEKIINFIKQNYLNYLNQYNIAMPEIVNDMLDLDKYKNDFSLFIEMSRLNFSASDDCEETENLNLRCYLVVRNGKPDDLNKTLMNASSAFYQMIRNKNNLGVAFKSTINSVDFFKYVEGTKYLVCAEFDLTLQIEI